MRPSVNIYATNLFGKTFRRTSEMTASVRYGHLRRWLQLDTSCTIGAYNDTPQQFSLLLAIRKGTSRHPCAYALRFQAKELIDFDAPIRTTPLYLPTPIAYLVLSLCPLRYAPSAHRERSQYPTRIDHFSQVCYTADEDCPCRAPISHDFDHNRKSLERFQ